MYGFDRQLRQLSAEQAAHTSDAEPEKPAAAAVYDEDLFQNCEPGGQSRPKPTRGRLYGAARYFARNRPSQAGGCQRFNGHKGFGPKKSTYIAQAF